MNTVIKDKKKLNLSNHREALFDMYSDMAEDFFGEDIDKSKSSFLRYLNEFVADFSADIQLQNSLMFNEAHLNTARFRESILNTASPLGYVEPLANPERIMSTISIRITDRDKNRPERLNVIEQGDLLFNDGNLTYMLSGDIEFIMNNEGVWSVTLIRAGMGREQLPSQLIEIPSEKGEIQTYLIFKSQLFQFRKEITTHIVSKRKALIFYKFQFSTKLDNLYDVKLSYISPEGEKRYLDKIGSVLDESPNYAREIFTLTSLSDNVFEISLDNGSRFNFIPSGTELSIEAYLTKGTGGRVKDPIFSVVNNSDSNREIQAYAEGYSEGGRDALSNIELKRDIYKTLQTPDRKTIITEQDFINIISDATGEPVDELAYLLRRNDPIQRQSDFFVKFNDHKGELLQTNSLDLHLDTMDERFFPSFSKFYCSMTSQDKPYLTLDESGVDDPDKLYYRNPLPMRLSTFPNYHMNVFRVGNNQSIRTVETYSSKMDTKFTAFPDYVTYRYDELTREFTVSVILKSNRNEIFQDPTITENLRVSLEFNNNFVEFIQDDVESYLFKATITTDEVFDSDNNMLCGNIIVKRDNGQFEVEVDNVVPLGRLFNSNIIVFEPGKDNVLNNTGDREVERIYGLMGTRNITVLSSRFVGDIRLFDVVNEIYLCNVHENEDATGLIVNGLPVIGDPDYQDPRNNESIKNVIRTLGNIYTHIHSIKEEPSTLAIKFSNTYGYTDEYSDTNSSNVTLNVEVTLNNNLVETGVVEDIKRTISDYVNTRGRFLKSGTAAMRHIYLSDIIRDVLSKVPGVIQMRILNISDNFYFRGSMDYKHLPKHKIEYYTPTILNTRTDYIKLTIR